MSTKEQLSIINQTVYEKLAIDNPLHRSPVRGEFVGFYPSDKSLTPQKATLRAAHDLFCAMEILASPAQNTRTYTRQSIVKLRESLETLLDNIKDLDPDILKLIGQFLDHPGNKEFIENAFEENPLLNTMSTTKQEFDHLLKLLYKNTQEFSEAKPALELAKLHRLSESYYHNSEVIKPEFFESLKNNYGISDTQINDWKENLKIDRDDTLLMIRKKIWNIGASRFGNERFHAALEDARPNRSGIPNPIYSKRTKPNTFKKTKMLWEAFKARLPRPEIIPKSPFSHLNVISSKRLLALREKQKTLDIIYLLEHKDPKHRTKDILLELWMKYKKETNQNPPLDFNADYHEFYQWVDEKEKAQKIPRITYLNPAQQELFKATIDHNAIKIFGGLADTSSIKGDKPGLAAFVMDNQNNIYLGEKEKHEFQHSSFLSGADVSCAGYVKIQKGKIIAISNESGHYKPDDLDLAIAISVLREKNVLHPNFVIAEGKFPFLKLGNALINVPGFYTIARALKGFKRKTYLNPDTFVQNVFRKYSKSQAPDTYSQAISYLDKAPAHKESQSPVAEPAEKAQSKRKLRIRWPNMKLLIKAKSSKAPSEEAEKVHKNQNVR